MKYQVEEYVKDKQRESIESYADFAKQFCDEIEENHLENNGDVQDLYITEYLSHIDMTDEEYEEEYDKVCFAIQQELNKRKE